MMKRNARVCLNQERYDATTNCISSTTTTRFDDSVTCETTTKDDHDIQEHEQEQEQQQQQRICGVQLTPKEIERVWKCSTFRAGFNDHEMSSSTKSSSSNGGVCKKGGEEEIETKEYIKMKLYHIEKEIDLIPDKKKRAYHCALGQEIKYKTNYVRNPEFLIMFLRSEKMNASKAAIRLVKFFQIKLELFGLDKLTHTIAQNDLNENDRKILYSGCIDIFGGKDSMGSIVCVTRRELLRTLLKQTPVTNKNNHTGTSIGTNQEGNNSSENAATNTTNTSTITINTTGRSIDKNITPNDNHDYIPNLNRVLFYLIMMMLENDEETQKHGFVFVCWNINSGIEWSVYRKLSSVIRMMNYMLPYRGKSVHFCYNGSLERTIAYWRQMLLSKETRSRTFNHDASPSECLQNLATQHKIDINQFPISATTGEYQVHSIIQKLKLQEQKEQEQQRMVIVRQEQVPSSKKDNDNSTTEMFKCCSRYDHQQQQNNERKSNLPRKQQHDKVQILSRYLQRNSNKNINSASKERVTEPENFKKNLMPILQGKNGKVVVLSRESRPIASSKKKETVNGRKNKSSNNKNTRKGSTQECKKKEQQQPHNPNPDKFPLRLMKALGNNSTPDDGIWWILEGNAFAIDVEKFTNYVLHEKFYGLKFDSFTRSLRRWGFKRLPTKQQGLTSNIIIYQHPLFQKDSPELLQQWTWKNTKSDYYSPHNLEEVAVAAVTIMKQQQHQYHQRQKSRDKTKPLSYKNGANALGSAEINLNGTTTQPLFPQQHSSVLMDQTEYQNALAPTPSTNNGIRENNKHNNRVEDHNNFLLKQLVALQVQQQNQKASSNIHQSTSNILSQLYQSRNVVQVQQQLQDYLIFNSPVINNGGDIYDSSLCQRLCTDQEIQQMPKQQYQEVANTYTFQNVNIQHSTNSQLLQNQLQQSLSADAANIMALVSVAPTVAGVPIGVMGKQQPTNYLYDFMANEEHTNQTNQR